MPARNPWPTWEELGKPMVDEKERDKKTAPPQYLPSVFGPSDRTVPVATGTACILRAPAGSVPTLARILDWTLFLSTESQPGYAKRLQPDAKKPPSLAPAATISPFVRSKTPVTAPSPPDVMEVEKVSDLGTALEPIKSKKTFLIPAAIAAPSIPPATPASSIPPATQAPSIPPATPASSMPPATQAPSMAPTEPSSVAPASSAPPGPTVNFPRAGTSNKLKIMAVGNIGTSKIPKKRTAPAESIPPISSAATIPPPKLSETALKHSEISTAAMKASASSTTALNHSTTAIKPSTTPLNPSATSAPAIKPSPTAINPSTTAIKPSTSAINPSTTATITLSESNDSNETVAYVLRSRNYFVKLPYRPERELFDLLNPATSASPSFTTAPPNATLQFISGEEQPSDKKDEDKSSATSGACHMYEAHRACSRSKSKSHSPRKQSRSRSVRKQSRSRSPQKQSRRRSRSRSRSAEKIRSYISSAGKVSIQLNDFKLDYTLQRLESIRFAALCLAPLSKPSAAVDETNACLGAMMWEDEPRPKYYSVRQALDYWLKEVASREITIQSLRDFNTDKLRKERILEELIPQGVDAIIGDLAALGWACRCLARDLGDHQKRFELPSDLRNNVANTRRA